MFNFLGGLYSKPYGRHVVTYYVAVLLVALMVAPVLFNGHPMEFELKFSFFLLVCLVWWWGNGLLLLFAVQAFLVVVEPRGMQSTYAWMVALLGGTLVILIERFKSLKRFQQDYARVEEKAQAAEQLVVKEDGESPIVDGLLPEASPETKAVMHPLRVVVVSVATALLAVFLLECVPLFPNANSRVGLLPAEFRMLMICFLLFMAYLATWVILGTWSWRQLGSSQARVYQRNLVVQWIEDDGRRVVKHRQRIEKKNRKKAAKAVKAAKSN